MDMSLRQTTATLKWRLDALWTGREFSEQPISWSHRVQTALAWHCPYVVVCPCVCRDKSGEPSGENRVAEEAEGRQV